MGCRWVLVDATWDCPLGRAGFTVNDHWDGYLEMKCAVKPLKFPVWAAFRPTLNNGPCRINGDRDLCPTEAEKDHWDSEDQARYYREKIAVSTPDEVEQNTQFYRDFEDWLIEVRQ